MNIACDARALFGPRAGVGTWTVNVMGGLARRPGFEVTLWAPRPLAVPDELTNAGVRAAPAPPVRLPGTLWLHTLLPAALADVAPDVFIAPLGVAPRRCPTPTVVVVHDLTPRTLPRRHTLANRFCFNAYLEESLLAADAVVTVSEATRTEVVATFPRVDQRTVTIRNGVDERYTPGGDDEREAIRRRFSGGRPYILHLGTLEPRKGIPGLIAAWERLATETDAPDLVLAGAPGWGTAAISRRIEASPLRDRIHAPGYVDADDAPRLLRAAELFVLASEAEGFGLPLAEALCCGTPAVASDLPVLREVAGDAALYAAPGRPVGLAATIRRALEEDVRERLRDAAARRAASLRWGPAVDTWANLLRATARRSSA